MNTKNASPRPLIPLRANQIEQIISEDDFLATEVANMREQLAEYGIVLARRNEPLISKVEAQRLRRQRHADAGFCMYSKKHGKATHGTRCTACYEVNQKNMKDRRDKARQIKEQKVAKNTGKPSKKTSQNRLTW